MPRITTIFLPKSYRPPVPKPVPPSRKSKKARRKAKLARKALRGKNPRKNGPTGTSAFKADYVTYLASDHWKALSGRIRGERGSCEACGISRRLNVHHGTYVRRGRELDSDLFLLCEPCHRAIHRRNGKNMSSLMADTTDYVRELSSHGPVSVSLAK